MDNAPRFSSKAAYRRWARATRATLDTKRLSEQVTTALAAWDGYRRARHVLSYLAFGSELDLSTLETTGKCLYVTREADTGERALTLHVLGCALERHPLGFMQPCASADPVAPEVIELALVPGLCFDPYGTRLGYGLGYYDRLLPRLRCDVPRVGVVAGALLQGRLPQGRHDIPMTHLLTEMGVRPVCPD